jgi:hypothetical protein
MRRNFVAEYDPVAPVAGVNSLASGQQKLNAIQEDARAQESRWKDALEQQQAVHIYSCYMLMIQVINHLSLDKIDGQVIAESQMMNVEQQMQSKMVDISKFISQLEQESTSYTPYLCGNSFSPDSFLGLKSDFYQIGQGISDYGQETPSSDYQTSMDNFTSAFKTLFYCNTDENAPTVGSLSKIINPNVFQGGQDFDLTGMWTNLSAQYSSYDKTYTADMSGHTYSNPVTYKVVSADPNDKASLIQQYMFYKAQLTVDGSSIQVVDDAHGDITKLIDLGTDDGGDAFIQQAMQIITMLNTSEDVRRAVPEGVDNPPSAWASTQSDNIVDLILQGQRFNYNSEGTLKVGLYGAFSYKGFNYFWSKASSSSSQQDPSEIPFPSVPVKANGVGGNDSLTSETTSVNNVITSLGTVTSAESTKMQELTSNEGENVNIAQNAIKSLNTSVDTLSQNQVDS